MKSRKLIYIVCLAAVFITNCLYYNYQFFMIFIMAIFVPLISWGMFIVSRTGLKLKCNFKDREVNMGEQLRFDIVADNDTPVGITWGKVKTQISYSNVAQTQFIDKFISLDNSGVAADNIRFVPNHCGIVRIYISEFEVRDLIQLFSVKYKYGSVKCAAVLPEPVIIDEGDTFGNAVSFCCTKIFSETDNTEVIGLRAYADGDALNHIHWKRSIDSENFIVKEYGEEILMQKIIVADLSYYEETDFRDNLDLIYQAVYSIALLYVKYNIPSKIVAWDMNNNEAYIGTFCSEDELKEKMFELMSLRCSDNNLNNIIECLEGSQMSGYEMPMIITASDVESDMYETVNVKKDDLREILSDISKRLI